MKYFNAQLRDRTFFSSYVGKLAGVWTDSKII